MAGTKISAQTDGGQYQAGDELPVNRGGASKKVVIGKDVAVNSSTAYTIDQANGRSFGITLTAATPVLTLATPPTSGKEVELIVDIIQDNTGGRIPSWANVTWDAGVAPTIKQAANATTTLTFKGTFRGWIGFASQSSAGIIDGSSALAGNIGEIISSNIAIASATSLTTATDKTITSISLTAGQWMITGNIGFIAASGTIGTLITGSINTTTNAQATSPNGGAFAQIAATMTATGTQVLPVGSMVVNITSTTIYYLVATSAFSVSTMTAYGYLAGRRIR